MASAPVAREAPPAHDGAGYDAVVRAVASRGEVVAREPGSAMRQGATIRGRSFLTDTIGFFDVRPDAEVAKFVPGQYVTLGIADGDSVVERAYSIASSARRVADGYELYVRLVPGGALTPRLFALEPGARVSLRRPKGRFTLAPDDTRTHLFVATGCGLAPFMAMLRTLDDDGAPRPVVLVHGVSYRDELGYREELERLARDPRWTLTYIPTISRPSEASNAGWHGRTGRAEAIIGGVVRDLRLAPDGTVAYVCGNPEMTVSVARILEGAGFDPRAIHKEQYWPLRA